MRFLVPLGILISGLAYSQSYHRPGKGPPLAEACLRQAQKLFDQNEFDSALLYYRRAANSFKTSARWNGYTEAMAGNAFSLIRLRKYEDARVVLDSALLKGRRSEEESAQLARVYYVYGILNDFTNKPDQSLAMHTR